MLSAIPPLFVQIEHIPRSRLYRWLDPSALKAALMRPRVQETIPASICIVLTLGNLVRIASGYADAGSLVARSIWGGLQVSCTDFDKEGKEQDAKTQWKNRAMLHC